MNNTYIYILFNTLNTIIKYNKTIFILTLMNINTNDIKFYFDINSKFWIHVTIF